MKKAKEEKSNVQDEYIRVPGMGLVKLKERQEKVICFHGTEAVNATNILVDGFKKGTYFAKHLEDALEFGGLWVFQACFDEEQLPPGCWQFRIRENKSHTDIVRLTFFGGIEEMYVDPDVVESVSDSGDIRSVTRGF